jgi:hypothetical protein
MSCPHVWTADEGTSGCELAGMTAKQWESAQAEIAALKRERDALTSALDLNQVWSEAQTT